MNAVALLKADHRTVKGLFREFEAAGERAHKTKQRLGTQILDELDAHAAIEEEIFYPAVQARAAKELRSTVAEGVEEHHVVHVLIGELRELDATDERFEPKFTVLIESVEHHIEEEEQEMLPAAEKLLGDEVETLGEQMAARKEQLRQQAAVR